MKAPVTLLDVANAAKVSKSTAANVFNRPERVRPELLVRVQEAAARLGYLGPNPRGRLLSLGKVNAIGIVSGSPGLSWIFTDLYMREFLAGIADVCEKRGVGMSLIDSTAARSGTWNVESALVDGFILGTMDQVDFFKPILSRQLPFVVMDIVAAPDINSVSIDDRGAARNLTRHLLGLGHRRLAIASIMRDRLPPALHRPGADRTLVSTHPTDNARLAGVGDALAEAGLSLDDMPIVEGCRTDEELKQYGDASALLFDNMGDATAIVAMSGKLALTALDEAHRRKIGVPGQLSIAGFDDPPEAALADPPITMIAIPGRQLARAAAELLFAGGPPQQIVLPVEMIVRASTAPPPATAAPPAAASRHRRPRSTDRD
jgi:DNA-binding LacI/PurR family transcriptional regulator